MVTLLLLYACAGSSKQPPTDTAADADTDSDADTDADTDTDTDTDTDADTDTDTDTDSADSDGDGSPDEEDCAPSNDQIYPGADEYCNGYDDNCDGAIDDGASVDATIWYPDTDGDTYGSEAPTASCSAPANSASNPDDCDDTNPAVNPGAPETCNGLDDDCDSVIDPDSSVDASTWYTDADLDTWGDPTLSTRSCEAPAGSVALDGDCNDAAPATHPGATELCNNLDDDCDSVIDPDSSVDASTFYGDADGDTFGDPSSPVLSCTQPTGATSDATDCDDGDPAVNPAAAEYCNDVDDDCDTVIDPDSSADAGIWYADLDGDTHGDVSDVSVACDAPAGTVADSVDCDDDASTTYTGAPELCDGIDQDCDGVADNDATDASAWYLDSDGDGYGLDSAVAESCTEPSGWAASGGDCDDADPASHPGASEICGDGLDQDCDGLDAGDADCAPSGTITSADATLSGSGASVSSALAVTGDLDGDGHDELVVGAPTWTSSTGAAYVFDAVSAGTSRTTTGADWRFEGGYVSDNFGVSVAALGDVDGDGLPELVIGASGDDTHASGAGAVYVFSGASAAHASAYSMYDAVSTLVGSSGSDAAGSALGNAGDVDGDGLDDLWIGAGGHDSTDSNAGSVYVAFGDGLASETLGTTNQARFDGERASDAISAAAAVGDVDGDGYGDLAFASTASDERATSSGQVWVWRGPLHAGQYEVAAAQTHIVGTVASDWAGSAVTAGDVDGDGNSDLVVGAYGTDSPASGAGSVGVFFGPLPIGEMELGSADTTITGTASSDGTGGYLSAGDIDGDGRDDLVLGVPYSDLHGLNAGGAFGYYGPLTAARETLSDADLAFADGVYAGGGVLVADLDRDGFADLSSVSTAGAYGQVEIMFGGSGSTGVVTPPDRTTDDDGDGYSEEAGDCDDLRATRSPGLPEMCDVGGDENCDGYADRCGPVDIAESALDAQVLYDHTDASYEFGDNVGVIGDVNGDGALDVAIQDSYYSSHAGRVLIFFGPVPTGSSMTAASADVELTGVSSNDYAGDALSTAGDLDGDGYDDLFVGAPRGSYSSSHDGIGYILRGGPTLFGTISLEDSDWIIHGDAASSYAGFGGGQADLDGDGYDDLIFSAYGENGGPSSGYGRVSVAYGPIPTGTYSNTSIADLTVDGASTGDAIGYGIRGVGDVTGDGVDDLLIGGAGTYFYLLYKGPLPRSGTLDDLDVTATISAPYGSLYAIGDLSGDGLPDLLTPGGYVVPLNTVVGIVDAAEAAVATITDPSANSDRWAIADLDRSGTPDLIVGAVASAGNDNGELQIFYGPLAGDYSVAYSDVTVTGDSDYMLGASLDAGDLDQDGFADVLVGAQDYGTSTYEYGAFGVLRGGWTSQTGGALSPAHTSGVDADGDGLTGAGGDCDDLDPAISPLAAETCDVTSTDEDCDGVALECTAGERIESSLHFQVDGYNRGLDTYLTGIGDQDGDGLAEALVVQEYYRVSVASPPYPMDRTFTADAFDNGAFIEPMRGIAIVDNAPDIDGDGKQEWSVGSSDGTVWLLDSTGGIGTRDVEDAPWTYVGPNDGTYFGQFRDVGADAFGDADATVLTAAWRDSTVATYGGIAYVFAVSNDERGTFQPADARITISDPTASDFLGREVKILGDCDGDGLSELAITADRSSGSDVTYIWKSDGPTGALTVADLPIALSESAGSSASAFSPGDVDGDGLNDLVMGIPASSAGSAFGWSGIPADGAATSSTSADWSVVGSDSYEYVGDSVAEDVDFDGDGQVDLIVAAPYTYAASDLNGQIYGWFGPITLSGANDASDLAELRIFGEDDGQEFGTPLIAAGDVDGDGFEDLWTGQDDVMGMLVRGGPRN